MGVRCSPVPDVASYSSGVVQGRETSQGKREAVCSQRKVRLRERALATAAVDKFDFSLVLHREAGKMAELRAMAEAARGSHSLWKA